MKKILFSIIIILTLINCSEKKIEKPLTEKSESGDTYRSSFIEFSTDINVTIYNYSKGEKEFNKIICAVRNIFKEFDKVYNPVIEESELFKLNKAAQRNSPNFIKIPDDLKKMIKTSYNLYQKSSGFFDPGIYNIVEEWGFITGHKPKILTDNALKKLVKDNGFKNILIKEDSIAFLHKNLRLGFGAIAKGSSVDSVAQFLLSKGVSGFIIDAGGDLLIKGGRMKSIGIRHPREKILLDTLKLTDKAVATSGDYEKFFMDQGKRYHHLINPHTGKSDSDLISVTVISDYAETSDALATMLFVMGFQKAEQYMKNNNIQGILVTIDQNSLKKLSVNLD